MRASYWFINLLLFLFFPCQSFKQNTFKSFFPRANINWCICNSLSICRARHYRP